MVHPISVQVACESMAVGVHVTTVKIWSGLFLSLD